MKIEWIPTAEGTRLELDGKVFDLSIDSTKELAEDMEEAYMLARGHEKLRIKSAEVEPHDKVYFLGRVVAVTDVLTDRRGVVLQTHNELEFTVAAEATITVWRRIQ